MKIETEYNLRENVFFLEHGNKTGDVNVRCGMIKGFEILCTDNGVQEIVYKLLLDTDSYNNNNWPEISEKFLFRNEHDVMKFFKSNMKIQLENAESKRKRLEEAIINEDPDDLPF